jgi:hypothetical protein
VRAVNSRQLSQLPLSSIGFKPALLEGGLGEAKLFLNNTDQAIPADSADRRPGPAGSQPRQFGHDVRQMEIGSLTAARLSAGRIEFALIRSPMSRQRVDAAQHTFAKRRPLQLLGLC